MENKKIPAGRYLAGILRVCVGLFPPSFFTFFFENGFDFSKVSEFFIAEEEFVGFADMGDGFFFPGVDVVDKAAAFFCACEFPAVLVGLILHFLCCVASHHAVYEEDDNRNADDNAEYPKHIFLPEITIDRLTSLAKEVPV